MSKFKELKERINNEYQAVTNSIYARNSEYAYLWAMLDDLNDYVDSLEFNIDCEFMNEEDAYKRLCWRIENKLHYMVIVSEKFYSQLPFTLAKGIFFSLTNLINEIDERNN